MARGTLRIYLGAAPGVGKTYAMLAEGNRRAARGGDVVVGFVDTRDRIQTAEQIQQLEVVPRMTVARGAGATEEMDLEAILVRRPAIALVDDLAHANAPGMQHARRWQDVDEILGAGIDVIATLNVQHLESLADVVERITGMPIVDTVPDAFVRAADQVELVDMSPEALRRRLAHGNVYPAEQVDAAMSNLFRPGNLSALRELALLWVADRTEEALRAYLADHDMASTWETRERVVVALTGAPGSGHVVRRAARIAGRLHGDLVGVHVASPDGSSGTAGPELERHRSLLVELGGTYREVVGADVAGTLATFAGAEHATQVVMGSTRKSRWNELARGSLSADLQRRLPGVDVHIIAQDAAPQPHEAEPRHTRRGLSAVPPRRELAAWVLCLAGLPTLTALLVAAGPHLDLATALLLNLALVLAVSAIGGIRPGLFASVAASLLTNWYLTPPTHTWSIATTDNVIALSVFVTVAVLVSTLVDRSARRSREARRARADAAALARSTAVIIGSADPLPNLVEQVCALFQLDAVAILDRVGDGWVVNASAGDRPPTSPADGTAIALDDAGKVQLVLRGDAVSEADLDVLRAFGDQMALALEARRLRRGAQEMEALAQTTALRTALLQAVSHDLRTPLASIKASVTGLMAVDVGFTADDRASLLEAIDTSSDRLDRVIGNLLDMSRLQAGATDAHVVPTALEEVVAAALSLLHAPSTRVRVEVSEQLPLVSADPALLERAIANLVSNALAWSDDEHVVRIDAQEVAGHVELRVVDRGPGIPIGERDRVFQPFQRLGDRSSDAGAGLGLAIAKGFVELTGSSLELDDTPGGGCTFTISLPISPPVSLPVSLPADGTGGLPT